jgi:hypothetical protein
MAEGFVVSARGEKINMSDLIDRAKRPLNIKQAASEVTPRVIPKKAINVRGHRPSGAAPVILDQPIVKEVLPKAPASSFTEDGKATSLADLTGIKIDKARFTKATKKGDVDPNAELDAILNNLEATTKDTSGMKDE